MNFRKKSLVNVGINPSPAVPDYYYEYFDTIIHICPGKKPGKVVEISPNEYLYSISNTGFDIRGILYLLPNLESSIYIEIALQSGIDYPGLSFPSNAIIMGRMCDLHHLVNPLTGALSFLKIVNFDCLIFSSCPHYIKLFEEILPSFYLPTDINPSTWVEHSDSNEWLSRPIPLHIDGQLLSPLHPLRSYLYNFLYSYAENEIELPICKNYTRTEWISKLGLSQIVVQCGLNGNAHPPFLTAISRGAIPFIDPLSSWTLSQSLNINLRKQTYHNPSSLISLLRHTPLELYKATNIAYVSNAIRAQLNSNIKDWINFLNIRDLKLTKRYFYNDTSGPSSSKAGLHAISNETNDLFTLMQAFQELMRRCSYLSKGYAPLFSLVYPNGYHNYTSSLRENYLNAYNRLCITWPINVIPYEPLQSIAKPVHSLDQALELLAKKLERGRFPRLFATNQNYLTASILVYSALLGEIP